MEGIGKYGGGNRDSHLKEYRKYRIIFYGKLWKICDNHPCKIWNVILSMQLWDAVLIDHLLKIENMKKKILSSSDHTQWHSIIFYLYNVSSNILSGSLSGILSDICSDIPSGGLSDVLRFGILYGCGPAVPTDIRRSQLRPLTWQVEK